MSVKMVSGYSIPGEVQGSASYGDFGYTRGKGGPARGVRPYWAGQDLTSAQFNDFQAFAGCNCGGQRAMGSSPTILPGTPMGPPLDASSGLKGVAAFGLGLALLSMFGGKRKK